MKIFKLLMIGLIFVGLSNLTSCKKNNPGPNNSGGGSSNNPSTQYYQLRFTSTSNNPYLIEINGTSSTIQGNTFKNYNLKKGTYAYKITQKSGYLFYPTVNQGTVNLNQDKEIVFPY